MAGVIFFPFLSDIDCFVLPQHPLARVRWHAASACAELLSMNESTRVNFVSRVLCDMANPQDVATFSSELGTNIVLYQSC
jgi:hypothetical protein